jgi:hypothetical protein
MRKKLPCHRIWRVRQAKYLEQLTDEQIRRHQASTPDRGWTCNINRSPLFADRKSSAELKRDGTFQADSQEVTSVAQIAFA